ncbi:hypothetical protein TSAR_006461 [Trichomalopsis sarcophagae]|uniref:Caspase family p20 domain-containing protein n=1 Tax=Trichomalopsis sarcophagae TaxID=543379 RepID=A0A232EQK8_9HYME|nr:hypothetical protein TSAR_006461 [Trichomalopsis sarcophagae]
MELKDRQKIDHLCNQLLPSLDIERLWPKLLEHKVYNRDDVNIPNWQKNLSSPETVRDICCTIKTRGPRAYAALIASLRQSDHQHVVDQLESDGASSSVNNANNNNTTGDNVPPVNDSLENSLESSSNSNYEEHSEDDYHTKLYTEYEPLVIKVKKAEVFRDEPQSRGIERYAMRSNPRGLVLMITNIDYKILDKRPSAKYDEDNLTNLFEEMGFRVIKYKNLTGNEIKKKVREFSQMKELARVDSVFVIISSHGSGERGKQETEIQGIDYELPTYESIFCTDIIDNFTAMQCPSLINKPKIFIFQTCSFKNDKKIQSRSSISKNSFNSTNLSTFSSNSIRGDKHQKAVVSRFATDAVVTKEASSDSHKPFGVSMRNYSDTIIAYATLPGYVSYRDTHNGSWFIQILCEVFMNYACEKHVQDLFTMTDGRIKNLRTGSDQCQTLSVINEGFHHCYLNPGLFDKPTTMHLNKTTYTNLIASLHELQLHDVADHLQRSVIKPNDDQDVVDRPDPPDTPTTVNSDCISFNSSDEESDEREDNFHTKLQVVTEPLTINVKKATKFRDRPEVKHIGAYPMRSNPRGLVLIIANNLYKKEKDRRPSAIHDEANLKKLFTEMGFKVISHFDLTGKQIESKIEEFSQMKELRRVDAAFVIISSHGSGKPGNCETEITGIDYKSKGYKKVVCTSIMNYFTAEHCRYLSGKPKIFIFQTCRGSNEQVAVPRHAIDAVTNNLPRIEEAYVQFSETMRNYEDMLIVYSTIPGFVSYRDEYNGTWFIQILCEVFMNYAHKVHVRELFDMIDFRLKNFRTPEDNCQTPSVTSRGFNRHCYLNPGLFEDKTLNENHNIIPKTEIDLTFKCCTNRKANIYVCTRCESVYHRKCARKLNNIRCIGKVKADCCSSKVNLVDNEDISVSSVNEVVEDVSKITTKQGEVSHSSKREVSRVETKHFDIVTNGVSLAQSLQNSKLEKLESNYELLQQVVKELRSNNELLRENNERLTKKLKKKKRNHWVRKNLGKVLKKRKKQASNVVEPVEI